MNPKAFFHQFVKKSISIKGEVTGIFRTYNNIPELVNLVHVQVYLPYYTEHVTLTNGISLFCVLNISSVVLSSFQENPYQSITNFQVKIFLRKI